MCPVIDRKIYVCDLGRSMLHTSDTPVAFFVFSDGRSRFESTRTA